MTTPQTTELPRRLQATEHDDFIDERRIIVRPSPRSRGSSPLLGGGHKRSIDPS
jgi:hypothetical protein